MSRKIRIRGDRQAAAHLRRIARNCEDFTPVWPKVGNYLSSRVNRQFLSGGKQFGTPWKKLKPEYALWKRRQGYPGKILVMSGELMKSFTGRPMSVEVYTPSSATFGSNDPKAGWHHRGTFRNGKRVLPARKILVVTREVRQDVLDIANRHVMSGRDGRR